MARPDSLQWTLSPRAASAEIPRFHSANSSGESSARPARVLHDHGEVAPVGERRGRSLEQVGMRHQLEHQVALGERPQDLAGRRAEPAAHRPDAAETGRRHLRVEQPLGVGDGVARARCRR